MYDFINEMPYIILMSIPISFLLIYCFQKGGKKDKSFLFILFLYVIFCVYS